MPTQLTIELLGSILQSRDLTDLNPEKLDQFFLAEEDIAAFAPDGICMTDPRNGDRVVYNSARARRPHDNIADDTETDEEDHGKPCLICQGRTTRVVDMAALSEGFTFINKNLYPIFYPQRIDKYSIALTKHSVPVHGYHFLQWTSSLHDKDWHNMLLEDRVVVLERLAALEKQMLSMPDVTVSIIKNYGHLVGGSLAHGHQQIAVSPIVPNKIAQDAAFEQRKGECFTSYLLRENPEDLMVKDYGPAVLLTPHFMRRPYDMFLVLKDTSKRDLHTLNQAELEAVADGWQDGIRIMLDIMPRIGKEVAYNITTHNGPGAGLYFEFLPYTQEMGGFEHLGLYLCQGNPLKSAHDARDILSALDDEG